jgi:23S rRNA pseudouridine1911/1915/1917 synthase
MASLKLPLVGDVLYGGQTHPLIPRQALHAERLSFEHPVTGQPMDFQSPLPDDFESLRQAWSLSYNQIA